MTKPQEAYRLYLENSAVVHHALHRLGLNSDNQDYEDYLAVGIEYFVHYYEGYHDPVKTEAQKRKFLRLVGHFVYLNILSLKSRQERKRQSVEVHDDAAIARMEQSVLRSDIEVIDGINHLKAYLTQREQELLFYRYYDGLDYETIRGLMGISKQSMRNLRSRLRRKYEKYWE